MRPEYTCLAHALAFQDPDFPETPDCLNGCGCAIGEHIATNEDFRRIAAAYILTKRLPIAESNHLIGARILREAGILQDLELLSSLEFAYYKAKQDISAAEDLKEIAQARHQQKVSGR